MNTPKLSEAEFDAITEAAAQWCMRLHEEDCTDAEREEFQRWLETSPVHAFEYEAMQEIWDTADHLPRTVGETPNIETASIKTPSPEASNLEPLNVVPLPVRRTSWRQYGIAAAVTLLALPVAGLIGWNLGYVPNAWQSFEATDQTRIVALADGSRVELNLGTRLTYANYKDQRRVTLSKGEAYFEVTHSVEHPFVVRAGEGQVRVTGTRFNVWNYQDQVRVTLLQGSVLVSSNRSGEGYRLDPGMQARYKGGDYEPQINQTYANDPTLAWRNGKLVLDNLSLNDALPLINRYLDHPVQLADSATGQIRIGGVYNTHDVQGLVKSLPKVLPVYLSENKDGDPVLSSAPRT
ncbi:FecR family protein [Pseudomonas sp. NPDC090202]|uniref:FecR family protein n=1 Tax=unclassified Pseudomonas TaxID=196821 RepID=UPI00382E135A